MEAMKSIPLYKFNARKYGSTLKVDVIDIHLMWENIRRTPFYRTTFFSIKLITEGNERLGVDGKEALVSPGVVVCARPSEIWQWQPDTALDGLHLLWKEDFLLSFFSDPNFLDHFAFLRIDRPSPFLKPSPELFQRLVSLFRDMQSEIGTDKPEKDQHILRAMLYEALMLLDRCPVLMPEEAGEPEAAGVPNAAGGSMTAGGQVALGGPKTGMPADEKKLVADNASRYIDRFQKLAHEHYRDQHDVDYYADKLAITSNYLNKIVRISLDVSTKQYLERLLADEAKRQLRYTTLAVADISSDLHFDTTSYFIRFFRKHAGMTPLEFRKRQKE